MSVKLFLKNHGYSDQIPDSLHKGVLVSYKRISHAIKHQFVVNEWLPYSVNSREVTKSSFEVEMTFETQMDVWATIKFYGLTEEKLKETLNILESKLVNSLISIGANPMHYRYIGED